MKNNKFTIGDFSKEFENAKHEEEPIKEFEEVCDECVISMDEEESVPAFADYIVSECDKLNIREEPDISAKVFLIANRNDVLVVDENFKDDIWCKVCGYRGKDDPKDRTVAMECYCMKKYLKVR